MSKTAQKSETKKSEKARRWTVPKLPSVGASPLSVSPRNISQFRQFRVTRIVRDLADSYDVPQEAVAKILVARGVVSAFNLRRSLSGYSRNISQKLRDGYTKVGTGEIERVSSKRFKRVKEYYKHLGYLEALREVKLQLEKILAPKGFELPKNESHFERLLWKRASEISS